MTRREITISLTAGTDLLGINQLHSISEDSFLDRGSGVGDQGQLSVVLNIDGVAAATASLVGQAG